MNTATNNKPDINIVSNSGPWYNLDVIQKGLQVNARGSFKIVYDDGEVDADPLIKNRVCAYFINDSGTIYTAASIVAGTFHYGRRYRCGFSNKGISFKDGNQWNVAADNLICKEEFINDLNSQASLMHEIMSSKRQLSLY